MGQKVNPISMRLQVNKDWRSKWYVNKRDYAEYLHNDLEVRRHDFRRNWAAGQL